MNTPLYAALLILALYIAYKAPERYASGRDDYRFGSIDTNPMRRVSGPFDGGALNNPYEGLPLP